MNFYSPLEKTVKGVKIIFGAEMAELADALGSGPSLNHLRWRFESSFRQFGSLSAPFSFLVPACNILQALENQMPADFAYRFPSILCKVLLPCAAGKKAGRVFPIAGRPLFPPLLPAISGAFSPTARAKSSSLIWR